MDISYDVRPVEVSVELETVFSIWQRNLSLSHEQCISKYHWYYETNPYSKGKLWFLTTRNNGMPVGVAGLGFRRFSYKGSRFKGAVLADLAVDKEHRILGPALQLEHTVIEASQKEADFLYAFPNSKARTVLQRLGYRKAGDLFRYVKVLRHEPYFYQTVHNRMLARPAAFLADLSSRNLFYRLHPHKGEIFHTRDLDELPGYDGLWTCIEDDIVSCAKDRTYLQWRYLECPYIRYGFFGAGRDGRTDCVLVYYLQNSHVYIVDIIIKAGRNRSFGSLLSSFEQTVRKSGAISISISFLGPETMSGILKKLGYKKRTPERSLLLYTSPACGSILDTAVWMLGDEDNN